MQRSVEQILTTHTGSLPRPPALLDALRKTAAGEEVPELAELARDAVAEVVRRQGQAGVSVVNDGEAGKVGYATYVAERLDGIGERDPSRDASDVDIEFADLADFPEFAERVFGDWADVHLPACVGPVSYRDLTAVRADIANLQAAVADGDAADVFLSAASPGVVTRFLTNQYYDTHEEYLGVLADAMKAEYDEIHRAGFVLQLDCPDLASSGNVKGEEARKQFLADAALHIEAINHATRDIPPERMRMHLCWGNYEGPHNHDVPLRDLIDLVFQARPAGIAFEAANPRHEHEWTVFADVKLPDGKVLIPGVLDSTTNYIEHPELVAQRIARYAELAGRENVIAGSDCGFATFADVPTVDPAIAWAKLEAMAEGARLATARLF